MKTAMSLSVVALIIHWIVNVLEQGCINYGPQATSGWPTHFVRTMALPELVQGTVRECLQIFISANRPVAPDCVLSCVCVSVYV